MAAEVIPILYSLQLSIIGTLAEESSTPLADAYKVSPFTQQNYDSYSYSYTGNDYTGEIVESPIHLPSENRKLKSNNYWSKTESASKSQQVILEVQQYVY